ncbi:tyrosine-protein kinase receptor TYRO3 precursor [Danio rerio]|uniref:Tyrosine-protein kinase receptor TYRO3 n=1 Tax=Danio rerio TaxID=7955 RepID=B3DGN7_DANRE|nr:tyrosine-protein kinase receptor TYRO3 precursor [Danio rerio]AAI62462.1 Dtk protein [Danio rerio]|eukprot:NP_571507.2 tyrosine-protein kinase receptor TYRO3 precursor [Danio rerio]
MEVSLCILLFLLHFNEGIHGVRFTKNPSNQTVTQGNMVRLGCAFEGLSEPEIIWMKDGEKLFSTDQMYITLDPYHWETFHSVKSVQQQDAGKYWCEVEYHGAIISSEPAWITVAGVPHFGVEPEDVAAFAGESFNLTCAASGPPEPVEVLWWLGGEQNGDFTPSPSVLFVKGVNESIKFHCEAKNARGISVSRTGTVHIKARPDSPRDVQVHHVSDFNITLTWSPGFTGHSQLSTCTIQLSRGPGKKVKLPDVVVEVPPFQHVFEGLRSYSNYSVRVRCDNEVGSSPFSPWVDFHTPQAAPSAAPKNFTFDLSEQQLTLSWATLEQEELRGRLLAYKLQWNQGGESQDPLLFKENVAHLSGAGRFFNATFQVAACTMAGCGPWSQPVLVMPVSAMQAQTQRGHMWVGLLFGLLVATMVGLLLIVLIRNRGKETQFGSAFAAQGAEVPVSFTAARSFNRQFPELPESTLDSLGINSDLKAKLQDVLISERLLTLGRMLGKGEFGSVREAFLKSENNSGQKVAVKVLKTDINSSSDIEQCLKEAAYMKDFHHPNVIQLIGVSLHRRAQQRLPVPMVILPFMKHGDLHTFLLMSRLGDEPFTVSQQILIQFMLDIARGMEYLSNKNIIHRDLAARNCMLNENMSVCVADFGLSKKIYSGDYYRQGSVSKLPVKWIALESLADNVYTTQSDVWAFGVTMWEIMTRGQTPYPGVENSEIYEYLIKGERLKQPPDCPADIYEIMHSCWSPVPKCRPSFQHLIDQLELLWAKLNPAPVKEPLLYVNLEEEDGEQANSGTRSSEEPSWGVPWQCAGIEEDEKDWLMVSSGAALAIGGDYRYIIGPSVSAIDEESRHSDDGLSEDIREEEEDVIINV